MFGEVGVFIGQALSIVAIITGFISFQMKTPKGILAFQIVTASVFSAHYFLINAPTAAMLNFLGVVMLVAYYLRGKRNKNGLFIPVFFTALTIIASVFTWNGWYSVFIMLGCAANAVGMALSDAQNIRKIYLIKSPLCLTYNIFVFSLGGIIYEVGTIISAIIGIIKNKKTQE
jgi:uncharacterized membrane protein (UPF0136 family)